MVKTVVSLSTERALYPLATQYAQKRATALSHASLHLRCYSSMIYLSTQISLVVYATRLHSFNKKQEGKSSC